MKTLCASACAACAAGVLVVAAWGDEAPAWTPELRALAGKAQEHYEAGRFKEAEATYLQALKKAPANLHLLSNLGVVQFRAQNYKLAEATLKTALKAAPDDDFAHCTLGIVFYVQGKLDAAIDELTKALAINPKNATAHNYLGMVAAQKGWKEAAKKELETATALDPTLQDSDFQNPAPTAPVGDFLTPLEKSRLKIPSSTYRPLQPPADAPRTQ